MSEFTKIVDEFIDKTLNEVLEDASAREELNKLIDKLTAHEVKVTTIFVGSIFARRQSLTTYQKIKPIPGESGLQMLERAEKEEKMEEKESRAHLAVLELETLPR